MAEDQEIQSDVEPLAADSGNALPEGVGGLDFVLEVPLRVTVQIGGARMLVRDVLQLTKGSVVELDRLSGEPADILVNDQLVARGEVTVIDDRMAVRVVEVIQAHG